MFLYQAKQKGIKDYEYVYQTSPILSYFLNCWSIHFIYFAQN